MAYAMAPDRINVRMAMIMRATARREAAIATGVALLFLVRFPAFYLLSQQGVPMALLGITPHLLIFPLIAALPAPTWAKQAGYGWLVIDMATDIMALNGVPIAIYLPLRYGGHISAALWIAAVSWHASRATRITGLALALNLGGYSFIASSVPFVALLPAMVLLPIWFVLLGRQFTRQTAGTGSSNPVLGMSAA